MEDGLVLYSQTKVISVFYSVFQLTFNSKHQTQTSPEYAVFTLSKLFPVARHQILGRQVPQKALWSLPGQSLNTEMRIKHSRVSSLPSPFLHWRGEAGCGPGRESCWSVCSPGPGWPGSPRWDRRRPPGVAGAGWSPVCRPREGWYWRSLSAGHLTGRLTGGRLFCHVEINLTAKEKLSIKTFMRLWDSVRVPSV